MRLRGTARCGRFVCGALLSLSCVVVGQGDPPADAGGTGGGTGTETGSGPGTETGTETGTGAESSGTQSSGTGGSLETHNADPEPPAFPIYWAVTPSTIPVPEVDQAAIEVRDDVFVIAPSSLGTTPASVEDLNAFLDAFAADVAAQVPAASEDGLAVVANNDWAVPWCGTPAADRETFAASPLGQGLDEAEQEAAWDAAAVAIMTGLLERGRAIRPAMAWASAAWRLEHWQHVSDDPDVVAAWRACHVLSPAAKAVWEVADVVVPVAVYYYAGLDDEVAERNALWAERLIDAARLSGRPVVPLFAGRYNASSETDTSPYKGQPLLERDVRGFIGSLRFAGAEGFIYAFEADGCWTLDDDCAAPAPSDFADSFAAYWVDVVLPLLVEFGAP